jgi:mRNA interferase MazF
VLLKRGEANLKKPSVVNVSQIFTLDKEDLTEYTGTLSGDSIAAVRNGLNLLFET